MPWVLGVDEAGYGPNLGPLVQAAVAIFLPDDDIAGWNSLKAHVRSARGRADDRIIIDDSKKVYTRGGLAALERTVHAIFGRGVGSCSFEDHFRKLLDDECWTDLVAEPWFAASMMYPLALKTEDLASLRARWMAASPRECAGAVSLVQAARFNRIVDESDSKAMVLSRGLVSLLMRTKSVGDPSEPLRILCDKQGGRNYYTSLVQSAFPEGWVVIEVESAAESCYRVEGVGRPVSISFKPKADGESLAVALASMLCKYFREVCMAQFNGFWAGHVPGLQPTAGYPVDARRFYGEIAEARARLGLVDDTIWRKR